MSHLTSSSYWTRHDLAARWGRDVRSVDRLLRRPAVDLHSTRDPLDGRVLLFLRTDVRRIERQFGITVVTT